MTTAERIEKLKADRRAQLVASEAARLRAEQDARLKAVADVTAAVKRAVGHMGEEWLLPFYVAADEQKEWRDEEDGCYRTEAAFYIPDHRPVTLVLLRTKQNVGGWLYAPEAGDCWAAQDDRGRKVWCETLADALIASEGDPAEPIPF